MLTETLGLSIASPYAAYGELAIGAINLGNLNLELLRHSDALLGVIAHSPARGHGIAPPPSAYLATPGRA